MEKDLHSGDFWNEQEDNEGMLLFLRHIWDVSFGRVIYVLLCYCLSERIEDRSVVEFGENATK